MINKFLPSVALVFASFFVIPALGHACNATSQNILETEKISLSDLEHENAEASLYNFRTGDCSSLSSAHSELEISAFLPSDETSLGIYQIFRDKGENQIDALKHTLQFNIHEQES